MQRPALSLLISLLLSAQLLFTTGANAQKRAYDVAAFVWPAYHPSARFSEIDVFPDGKGEWEAIYKAKPKYEGHQLPGTPVWGYESEADPLVMEKKIETALDYGVNVFIYDWYWFDSGPYLDEAINNGFLGAKNADRMQFYLMWANHDHNSYLDPANPDKKKVYWHGEVTRPTFDTIVEYVIANYFKRPNYYKINGEPVFAIYEASTLINGLGGMGNTKEALRYFEQRVKESGFPGLHIQGILWGELPKSIPDTPGDKVPTQNSTVEQLGMKSLTNYQWVHYIGLQPKHDYRQWGDKAVEKWSEWAHAFTVPFFSHVSVSWDPNPRFPVALQNHVVNPTPEAFEEYLRGAKAYADAHPNQPPLITINAWNEWAEGSYLEPCSKNGFKYLEAIRRVFVE